MNEKTLNILGMVTAVIGFGVSILSGWITGKKTDIFIEQKIMERLQKWNDIRVLTRTLIIWERGIGDIYNNDLCREAILIITEHINNTFPIIPYSEQTSYVKWTLNEILILLMDEAERIPPHLTKSKREPHSPITIIENFKNDLVRHQTYNRRCNPKCKELLKTAIHTADNILLLLV